MLIKVFIMCQSFYFSFSMWSSLADNGVHPAAIFGVHCSKLSHSFLWTPWVIGRHVEWCCWPCLWVSCSDGMRNRIKTMENLFKSMMRFITRRLFINLNLKKIFIVRKTIDLLNKICTRFRKATIAASRRITKKKTKIC